MADMGAIWNLRAYDSSNNLLDTYPLPADSSQIGYFVGLSANNISYATLINTSPPEIETSPEPSGREFGYDWIAIDNFNYKPIPEPVTLLLLGLGGLLLRKEA